MDSYILWPNSSENCLLMKVYNSLMMQIDVMKVKSKKNQRSNILLKHL